MIYEEIVKTINNYLGENFIIKYANNLDVDWKSILPEVQEKIAYGVLKVDSGTTTQLADTTVRTEQLTLQVAIPAEREIFNKDVVALRGMLKGLNDEVVYSDDEDAKLLFGEYQDANQQLLNSNYWWIASVVFTANFYSALYLSSDIQIQVNNVKLQGLFKSTYTREFVMDSLVQLNTGLPNDQVNCIKKSLSIDGVCMKSDTLIQTLFSEEDTIKNYAVQYNNGIVTRNFNAILALINEQAIMGDVIKITLTFLKRG